MKRTPSPRRVLRRARVPVALLLPALLLPPILHLAGCDATNPLEPEPGNVVEVRMTSGMDFDPATVQIEPGDRVRWINDSALTHTTTSGTGNADPDKGVLWDQALAPFDGTGSPETYEREFGTSGTFRYFCRIHDSMGMKGTVVVG
jgi:plastocyanin